VVIYHFMYGKKQTNPCPMCTMWIDGYNGVGQHLAQNVDFVDRRGGGSARPAPARPQPGLAQPSAAQLWNEHVQERPAQRGR
jgi:hypothetical protein